MRGFNLFFNYDITTLDLKIKDIVNKIKIIYEEEF